MRIKKNNKLLYLLLVLYSIPVYSEVSDVDDDFWLLEDYTPLENSLWIYAGTDEESGGYYGINTELAISTELHFNFTATRQNYNFKTDDLSWGFTGYPNDQFSWGIYQVYWGNKDALEKKDLRFMLAYFNQGFAARLSFERGDVQLFFRQPNIFQIDSLSRDHRATELSLSYSWQQIYAELRHKQHDYINNQSVLIPRLSVLRQVSSIGLQQARNLADSETSALLGLRLHDISYEIQLSQIDSAFSDNSYAYTSLYLLKSITTQIQLGVNIEIPMDDGLLTAGLSLGYMW